MSSPIKTRASLVPSFYSLPECMREFLAHCDIEEIQKERTADPYAPWKTSEKFVRGKVAPDAYLQLVKLQTESKVRTLNLTNSFQLVDFLLSTLHPMEEFGFIKRYKAAMFAEKNNPYVSFLVFFHREYMADTTPVSRYDEFNNLLRGETLQDNPRAVHAFLSEVRAAYLSLPEGFVGDKGVVVDLRRKLPESVRRRVLSVIATDGDFHAWLREAERVVVDLLQDEKISAPAPAHAPAPLFAPTPAPAPLFTPPAVANPAQPEGMDIGAVLSSLVLSVQGLQKSQEELKKKQQKKPNRSKGRGAGREGVTCFKCGGTRHFADECPSPPPNPTN